MSPKTQPLSMTAVSSADGNAGLRGKWSCMVLPEDALARVRLYYRLVDDGDVSGLVRLFTPDAIYERPGYEPLRGHAELTEFYRSTRVIASGQHTLHGIVCDGAGVAVQGQFEGTLKTGPSVQLRFADFFELSPDGLFSRRDTYFFQPMV
jgi:steroid Delta-isomerase